MNILLSYGRKGQMNLRKIILIVFAFLLIMPLTAKASGDLKNRVEVFSFLKRGYMAQVSLSEELRSKEEIRKVLNPYFSESYQKQFWSANIVMENGQYITYGTDFAEYYIPYYQFSERTKVVFMKNKIYVFEYFPQSSEGPVGYKSHYEGLLIKREKSGWKLDQYLFDHIPKNIIQKGKEAEIQESLVFSFLKIRLLYF